MVLLKSSHQCWFTDALSLNTLNRRLTSSGPKTQTSKFWIFPSFTNRPSLVMGASVAAGCSTQEEPRSCFPKWKKLSEVWKNGSLVDATLHDLPSFIPTQWLSVMRPRNPLLLLLLALALALALAFLPLALSCKSQNWASANGEAMPCYLKPKNRGPPGYLDDQVPRWVAIMVAKLWALKSYTCMQDNIRNSGYGQGSYMLKDGSKLRFLRCKKYRESTLHRVHRVRTKKICI